MLNQDQNHDLDLRVLELSHPESKRITSVMPAPSQVALALQDMEPEALIENMLEEVAAQILAEWRAGRNSPTIPRAQQSSIIQYKRTAAMLEAKYSAELNIEAGFLNPVDFIKKFFFHANYIGAAAWKMYRHSILYAMNERAIMMEEKGLPHNSLITALGALIVVTRHPYLSKGKPGPRLGSTRGATGKRVKTLRAKLFEELVTHLATSVSGRNEIARHAQSFAIATLATGLRPCEWKTAVLRQATYEEMPPGTDPAGWLAIRIKTAKRKEGEKEWYRTILVEPGLYQIHIRQHYESLMSVVGLAADRQAPDRHFIRRCSQTINLACKALWPGRPDRHCTLYTLRSQARANIAAVHGKYVSAGMLGHSPEKGGSYYAGHTKTNVGRGARNRTGFANIPIPHPGQDALSKAAEFKAREQSRASAGQAEVENVDDDDVEAEP